MIIFDLLLWKSYVSDGMAFSVFIGDFVEIFVKRYSFMIEEVVKLEIIYS